MPGSITYPPQMELNLPTHLMALQAEQLEGMGLGLTLEQVEAEVFDIDMLQAIRVLMEASPHLSAQNAYTALELLTAEKIRGISVGLTLDQVTSTECDDNILHAVLCRINSNPGLPIADIYAEVREDFRIQAGSPNRHLVATQGIQKNSDGPGL